MSNFHINTRIDDFSLTGKEITITNLDTLPGYEQILSERGLEYVVVKGLDIQAVGCAIIHPEDMMVYRKRLAGAVERDEQILGRRKAGLKELESDMARYDKEDGLKELEAELSANDSDVVLFTKNAVKKYLDTCIEYWRLKHDKGDEGALYYVDAYQSVRTSLFGESLGKEEGDEASV